MKTLVSNVEEHALLWTLTYGLAYVAQLAGSAATPSVPKQIDLEVIDSAAKIHADRMMRTIIAKGEELKRQDETPR